MALNLKLEELEHQRLAVEAVCAALDNVEFDLNTKVNPEITPMMRPVIQESIEEIQTGRIGDLPAISKDNRTVSEEDFLGIDVKMETGTGKTYVFTRTMYELHARYGFNKFILLTPSSAIREGTTNFINSDYADEHFRKHYDSRINLQTLESNPKSKSRRRMIPTEIREYADGEGLKSIDALIMTGAMLRSKNLYRDDYDQTISADGFDSSCPLEVLARTRPVVIIDEPHRFARKSKTFEYIRQLNPAMVLRYGATFPRSKATKTKPSVIDYDNLVYDLNSADAFNNLLVKGVRVQYPEEKGADSTKFKVTHLNGRAKTMTLRNESTKKSYEFSRSDNQLSKIHPAFAGLTFDNVARSQEPGETVAILSNGKEMPKDYTLVSGSLSQSYQETMMQQALENHFRIEKDLFEQSRRIKPSTLFFIDSIHSYRGDNNDGWLKTTFEKMLQQQLEKTIAEIHDKGALSPAMQEYLPYLEATLANIEEAHEGYFAEDLGTSDEDIARRVRTILTEKETLMTFKDENDNYNVMRFIFSKWTLREGWDLPNVFQIVKIRSSGSEVSKLQEVGRGLRLPVDVRGNRVTEGAEEFYLTYLVDFTEQDFATRLISEINADVPRVINVKNEIEKVAKARGMEKRELWKELVINDYIDDDYNAVEKHQDDFLEEYPEFATGLDRNRVYDDDKKKDQDTSKKKRTASIRPKAYEKLRSLWEQLSEKYMLVIQNLSREELDKGLDEIFSHHIFGTDYRSVVERRLERAVEGAIEFSDESTVGHYEANTNLTYGEFLKRAHKATGLPVDTIHRGIVRANKRVPIEKGALNLASLDRFIRRFSAWFDAAYATRFEYAHVGAKTGATKLTNSDGTPREEVLRTSLGRITDTKNTPPETYLYDVYDWDSPYERKGIMDSTSRSFDGVVEVFGKIPSKSIRIPTYSGTTTSPDFMYVINRGDGTRSVNFVTETKGMDADDSLRGKEKKAITSAQKFFVQLNESDDVDVYFTDVLHSDDIIEIIERLHAGESLGVKARTETGD